MRILRLSILAAIIAVAVAACGGTGHTVRPYSAANVRPRTVLVRKHGHPVRLTIFHVHPGHVPHGFVGLCVSTDCGAYSASMSWSPINWPSITSYAVYLNGTSYQTGVSSSPYMFTGIDCGVTSTFGVKAVDASGSSPLYTVSYTTPSCSGSTTNCFNNFASCGFPSATDVGVSNCSSLPTFTLSDIPSADYYYPGSGTQVDLTASVTISNYNITSYVFAASGVSNITFNGDCIITNGGGGSSTFEIDDLGANLTVENSTLGVPSCNGSITTAPCADWTEDNIDGGTDATITNNLMYGAVEGVGVGGGGSTISGNYILVNGDQSGAHSEDSYETCADGITWNDNTLLNPMDQSGVIYGDTYTCTACPNQFMITDNFMAGGGRIIQECSQEASASTSSMTFTGNDIGRCVTWPLTAQQTNSSNAPFGSFYPIWTQSSGSAPTYSIDYCGSTVPTADGAGLISAMENSNGGDSHGFWPWGGSYGIDIDVNCESSGTYAESNVTWSGNYWDDGMTSVGQWSNVGSANQTYSTSPNTVPCQ